MSINAEAAFLTDRIAEELAEARRQMDSADGALDQADRVLGHAEGYIGDLSMQAAKVLTEQNPRNFLEHAQSYADDVLLRVTGAQQEVSNAVDRLDQSAQAINTARNALQELEGLSSDQGNSEPAQEWPKDVPTVAELRERVELFDEAITVATEGAENAGWRLDRARDSLRTLVMAGPYVADRQQTARMIAEAGSKVGAETSAAKEDIKGRGQAFYNAGHDSAAALSGANELHFAVRAGLNPTPKSQQTTAGASVKEDPRVAWQRGDLDQGRGR